ncbi:MAG: hypothetical protein KAS32_22950 [Candidatus Peribacteraceae bacterium]|nr:hypothetical protein [Candidatus Peribacteraceae bacterium]
MPNRPEETEPRPESDYRRISPFAGYGEIPYEDMNHVTISRDRDGLPVSERIMREDIHNPHTSQEMHQQMHRDHRFRRAVAEHENDRSISGFMRDMMHIFSDEVNRMEETITRTAGKITRDREAQVVGAVEDMMTKHDITDRIADAVVDRVEQTIDLKGDAIQKEPDEPSKSLDLKATKIAGILLNDVQMNFTGTDEIHNTGFIEQMHERWSTIILEILNGERANRIPEGERISNHQAERYIHRDVSVIENPTDPRTLFPEPPEHVRNRTAGEPIIQRDGRGA